MKFDELVPREISLESGARELTDGADAWVWDGAVFISEDKATVEGWPMRLLKLR